MNLCIYKNNSIAIEPSDYNQHLQLDSVQEFFLKPEKLSKIFKIKSATVFILKERKIRIKNVKGTRELLLFYFQREIILLKRQFLPAAQPFIVFFIINQS